MQELLINQQWYGIDTVDELLTKQLIIQVLAIINCDDSFTRWHRIKPRSKRQHTGLSKNGGFPGLLTMAIVGWLIGFMDKPTPQETEGELWAEEADSPSTIGTGFGTSGHQWDAS